MEGIKSFFKSLLNWVVRYPLGALIAIPLLIGVSLMLLAGYGERFNVGGILGKLLGRKEETDDSRVRLANEVPEGRTELVGEVDEKGYKQSEVSLIVESHNPFRDKGLIKVLSVDATVRTLKLPTGVQDVDVAAIYQIQPTLYEVKLVNPESIPKMSSQGRGYFSTD